MNQGQPYMDMHSAPHMSSAQPYASQPATSGGVPQYPQYQQQQVLQPGSGHYAPAPTSYGTYGYANGVTSPQSGSQPGSTPVGSQVPSHGLTLPAMITGPPTPHTYMSSTGGPGQGYPTQHQFDTTGQVAPPGMKPRVTATLWEDEGSLCFQVEAKGVCVARREDNHMINGTKLLNVAGMTRGRRDGILKSEKTRHVVKIGPMHLKGVWIPFERALDFANKEKITELLYPLFVHNIGGLLYNPENASRTSAVLAATEQRRINGATTQGGQRPAQVSQPPALHHHHSMQSALGSHGTPTAHSIAPHPGAGRPGLDRAHTFPTPPTSASSVMGMGNQGSSYEWGGPNIGNNVAAAQPLSIDTGLSNTRSMPNTPASTPPGSSIQNMQSYPGQQSYDTPKQYYSGPPTQQGAYAPQNMTRYGQPITSNGYSKNDMGPPSAPGSGNPEVDHHDIKADPYGHSNSNGAAGHGTTGAEPDHHHHDSGYMSSNASAYGSNRAQYAYNPTTSIQGEHPHMSPELSGSPSQQAGSGRGTPRTATGTQPQWAQGYQTPPRPAPAGSLYNVVSDSRTSNSTSAAENYNPSGYPNASMNGAGTSAKRSREDDDQDQGGRPNSRGIEPGYDLKRRKTGRQDTLGAPMGAMPNMQGIKTGGGAVRQR